MANIYVKEPPTAGKIRLVTSSGDIDIELWSNEAPKACRNIIGLALEGYYDNCVFHRIVKNFIIQTGDPTGTGMGGESFYGEPFADEIHQRLRFTRRGLVACANSNEPGTNESQFFITLDQTPELQNKHTIWGRIEGPTIYNVLALADVEMRQDEPDRPVYAPKLLTVQVLENPFDDIVPRITREERKEQDRAKKEALRAKREGRAGPKTKKNSTLLSFGEAEEVEATALSKGVSKSSHDLLNDKRLKREAAVVIPAFDNPAPASTSNKANQQRAEENGDEPSAKKRKTEPAAGETKMESSDLASLRATHASKSAKSGLSSQISELESSLRDMSGAKAKAKAAAEEEERKRKKANRGRELLEEARREYVLKGGDVKDGKDGHGQKKGKAREVSGEDVTLAAMKRFQAEIRSKGAAAGDGDGGKEAQRDPIASVEAVAEEVSVLDREYGASDDDDDDWRNHRLDSRGKSMFTSSTKGAGGDRLDDYEVLDPRQPSAAAARLGFGPADNVAKAREEEKLRVEGRRGRDWVDERDWKGWSGREERGGGGGGGGGGGSGGSRPSRDDDRPGHGQGHGQRDGGGGRGRGRGSWGERGEADKRPPNHSGGWDGRSGSKRDELGDRSGASRDRR